MFANSIIMVECQMATQLFGGLSNRLLSEIQVRVNQFIITFTDNSEVFKNLKWSLYTS